MQYAMRHADARTIIRYDMARATSTGTPRTASPPTSPAWPSADRPGLLEGGAQLAHPSSIRSQPWQAVQLMAILMAMSLAEQLPLADVKNRLSEVVERVERDHGRVVITKRGRPAAVVLSIEDLESLEETLDVLADQPLLAQIRKSMTELEAGKATVLSKDEALALVRRK
jgi:antitoxin YefM